MPGLGFRNCGASLQSRNLQFGLLLMASPSPLANAAQPLRDALAACRPHFVAAAAFSALVNLLYLAPTLYMLLVYDRVMPTGSHAALALVSAVGLVAIATLAFLEWMRARLLIRSGARLEQVLAGPVLSAVLNQPGLSRVDRAQAMRQFDNFRQAAAGHAILAAFDAPWTPIYVLAAFLLNPAIGWLCVAAGAGMLGLAWLNERATRAPLQAANTAAASAYARQDHASAWSAEIRALGMGRALVAKQLGERHGVIDLQTRASFAAAGWGGLIRFVRLALQSGALGLGAWLAIDRQISPGAVIAASLLLGRALAPIEQIVGSWRSITQAQGAFAALNALFARDAAAAEPLHLPAPRGAVSLERVSVMTPTLERIALADVNLDIEPGAFIGVVGPSGAGKSTLLRVIAGAIDPRAGVVRIDGAARREWDAERLARHIGFLPQEFLLFSGSIRDNISRFRGYLDDNAQGVDMETVIAAQAAGAHEMILRLPDGYATQVGAGGAGLSAGQTQRIALARALFGDPSILILDEPNAHLDADGEAQLVQSLAEQKAKGVTILVAAHRGAVLSAADKLLMLKEGRVEMFGGLADVLATMRGAQPVDAAASPAPRKRA
jgi:ATP-binding cassette subfamily C protein